jgi:hypothetical protein
VVDTTSASVFVDSRSTTAGALLRFALRLLWQSVRFSSANPLTDSGLCARAHPPEPRPVVVGPITALTAVCSEPAHGWREEHQEQRARGVQDQTPEREAHGRQMFRLRFV